MISPHQSHGRAECRQCMQSRSGVGSSWSPRSSGLTALRQPSPRLFARRSRAREIRPLAKRLQPGADATRGGTDSNALSRVPFQHDWYAGHDDQRGDVLAVRGVRYRLERGALSTARPAPVKSPVSRRITTRLYWSNRGEVACESHAPDPKESRWFVEGWQLMPPRAHRVRYRCQHCGGSGAATTRRLHSIN